MGELTEGVISELFSNDKSCFGSELPEIVVQVTDLQPKGKTYGFDASDGKDKIKAIFNSRLSNEVTSGNIQNLGLVRLIDYTINELPSKSQKYLIVARCEVVSPSLEKEINTKSMTSGEMLIQPKLEDEGNKEAVTGDFRGSVPLKPKVESDIAKSVAQIVRDHRDNLPPVRTATRRRVYPLVSLNPYQGNWTIKVRVTSKGNMRTYKNTRGEGCVFNVELTDQDGTQIQATMFNEAARKFFDKFVLGKVYFISNGSLRVANKQFNTVQNDYEMTLNETSEVEEVKDEAILVPETKFNFVPIDQLGPYVNSKALVDVVGVVQSVSPSMSIRRKSDNESIPKREITIADETKKTVVISLWNELATGTGQELLDIADRSPIVAIKGLRVGDFQGVSLSTVGKSIVKINPDTPESNKLRSWYECEGKVSSMSSLGSSFSPSSKIAGWSMFSERVTISHIQKNFSLGENKPVYFSLRAYISFVKPDQTMWYRACKTCNRKVTDSMGGGYWCEACQREEKTCNLRYILSIKVTDASGEAWISAFNEQAEKILGSSAEELDKLKTQDGDLNAYHKQLKEATWNPHLFRVAVSQSEYNNEKRQRITVRALAPVDFAAESKFLLEEIAKIKGSK